MKADALRARIVEVLNGWLAGGRLRAARRSPRARRARSRSRGRAGRRLLRPGAARPRRAHPRRRAAQLLRRHRERDAGVPGLPAPLKALCVVPFGMEEGTSARCPAASSAWSSASRRSSASSARWCGRAIAPGTLIEDWGDDLEELSPLEVTLPVAREGRRERAGHAREPRHRDRHARAVVRRPRRQRRWKLELNIREREP